MDEIRARQNKSREGNANMVVDGQQKAIIPYFDIRIEQNDKMRNAGAGVDINPQEVNINQIQQVQALQYDKIDKSNFHMPNLTQQSFFLKQKNVQRAVTQNQNVVGGSLAQDVVAMGGTQYSNNTFKVGAMGKPSTPGMTAFSTHALTALTNSQARNLVPYFMGKGSRAKSSIGGVHHKNKWQQNMNQSAMSNDDGGYGVFLNLQYNQNQQSSNTNNSVLESSSIYHHNPDFNKSNSLNFQNLYDNSKMKQREMVVKEPKPKLNDAVYRKLFPSKINIGKSQNRRNVDKINQSTDVGGVNNSNFMKQSDSLKRLQQHASSSLGFHDYRTVNNSTTQIGHTVSQNLMMGSQNGSQLVMPGVDKTMHYSTTNPLQLISSTAQHFGQDIEIYATNEKKVPILKESLGRRSAQNQYYPGQKAKSGIAAKTGEYMKNLIKSRKMEGDQPFSSSKQSVRLIPSLNQTQTSSHPIQNLIEISQSRESFMNFEQKFQNQNRFDRLQVPGISNDEGSQKTVALTPKLIQNENNPYVHEPIISGPALDAYGRPKMLKSAGGVGIDYRMRPRMGARGQGRGGAKGGQMGSTQPYDYKQNKRSNKHHLKIEQLDSSNEKSVFEGSETFDKVEQIDSKADRLQPLTQSLNTSKLKKVRKPLAKDVATENISRQGSQSGGRLNANLNSLAKNKTNKNFKNLSNKFRQEKRFSESLDLTNSAPFVQQFLDFKLMENISLQRHSDTNIFNSVADDKSSKRVSDKQKIALQNQNQLEEVVDDGRMRKNADLYQSSNKKVRRGQKQQRRSPRRSPSLEKSKKKKLNKFKHLPKLTIHDFSAEKQQEDEQEMLILNTNLDRNNSRTASPVVNLELQVKSTCTSRGKEDNAGQKSKRKCNKKDIFKAFDVQDQVVEKWEAEVSLDDAIMVTYGRIKLEHRKRSFFIQVSRLPTDPDNNFNYSVAMCWTLVTPQQAKQKKVEQCFTDDKDMKIMVIDPYLGPTIHQKLNLTFPGNKATKYAYFKFWLVDPNQGVSNSIGSSDELNSPFQAQNRFGIKLTMIFGKDNYDSQALPVSKKVSDQQVNSIQEATQIDPIPTAPDLMIDQQSSQEQIINTEVISERTQHEQTRKSKKADTNRISVEEGHGEMEQEKEQAEDQTKVEKKSKNPKVETKRVFKQIQEIIKSQNQQNIQQSINLIIENEEQSMQIQQNLKQIKELAKVSNLNKFNFVYSNARQAKHANFKNIQHLQSKQNQFVYNRQSLGPLSNQNQSLGKLINQRKSSVQSGVIVKHQKLDFQGQMINQAQPANLVINSAPYFNYSLMKSPDQSATNGKQISVIVEQKEAQAKAMYRKNLQQSKRQYVKGNQYMQSLMKKRQENQEHMDQVAQKNQEIVNLMREKKQYLLVKQQLIRKEKEDRMIDLKRCIIKKCWRLHMHAEIILAQLIRKVFYETKRIAYQKEIKFKRHFASVVIVKALRRYLRSFGDPQRRTFDRRMLERREQALSQSKQSQSLLKQFQQNSFQSSAKNAGFSFNQKIQSSERNSQADKDCRCRLLPLIEDTKMIKVQVKQNDKVGNSTSNRFSRFDKQKITEPQWVEPAAIEVALRRRERVRHTLTFLLNLQVRQQKQENEAKEIFKSFYSDLAKRRAMQRSIERYIHTINTLRNKMRYLIQAHREQFHKLSLQFEEVKGILLGQIRGLITKSKSKDQFLIDIQQELENMSDQTKVWSLYFYLKWCRQYHAEIVFEKRQQIQRGAMVVQMFSSLVKKAGGSEGKPGVAGAAGGKRDSVKGEGQGQKKTGASMKNSKNHSGQQSPKEDPNQNDEEKFIIFSFDQIKRSVNGTDIDFLSSLVIQPSQEKQMKKLLAVHEKLYPKYQKQVKQNNLALQDWLQKPVNMLIYVNQFKYEPSQQLMALIILTAIDKTKMQSSIQQVESLKSDYHLRNWFKRRSRKNSH